MGGGSFGDGTAPALCGPRPGWEAMIMTCAPGFRRIAQGRLLRPGAAKLANPSTTRSVHGFHPCFRYMSQVRGVTYVSGRTYPGSGQKHHPCGARSSWSGQARRRAAPSRARHAAVGRRLAQRSVVCRLQGRVQAWQRPVVLSIDRHRPCLALSASVRSARFDLRRHSFYGLRTDVPRAWPAGAASTFANTLRWSGSPTCLLVLT
jgi:hypothetical protein